MRFIDLIIVSRLKIRLAGAPLAQPWAFGCFFLLMVFDGWQLANLDANPHEPGPYTAAVWMSFYGAVAFFLLAYRANGGQNGSDFFGRYFSLLAVIGSYVFGATSILSMIIDQLGIDTSDLFWSVLVTGGNFLMYAGVVIALQSVSRNTTWRDGDIVMLGDRAEPVLHADTI